VLDETLASYDEIIGIDTSERSGDALAQAFSGKPIQHWRAAIGTPGG